MSTEKDNQELDKYLAGKSDLSASYHAASREQPPAQLDQSILAASRRAVKARPRYAFSPFASDWHVPASLAAVLILCVGLVITMQKETGTMFSGDPGWYQTEPAMVEEAMPQARFTADSDVPEEFIRLDKLETFSTTSSDIKIINGPGIKKTPPTPPPPESAPVIRSYERSMGAKSGGLDMDKEEPAARQELHMLREDASRPEDTGMVFLREEITGSTVVQAEKEADAFKAKKESPDDPRYKILARESIATVQQETEEIAHDDLDYSDTLAAEMGTISKPDAEQFINALTGQWQGEAVKTPVGPLPYDITLQAEGENCIAGVANNNFSNHFWTFCNRQGELVLDFRSDFRGNNSPINFKAVSSRESTTRFLADTHQFMDLFVTLKNNSVTIRVMHYEKLHVEIVLSR